MWMLNDTSVHNNTVHGFWTVFNCYVRRCTIHIYSAVPVWFLENFTKLKNQTKIQIQNGWINLAGTVRTSRLSGAAVARLYSGYHRRETQSYFAKWRRRRRVIDWNAPNGRRVLHSNHNILGLDPRLAKQLINGAVVWSRLITATEVSTLARYRVTCFPIYWVTP